MENIYIADLNDPMFDFVLEYDHEEFMRECREERGSAIPGSFTGHLHTEEAKKRIGDTHRGKAVSEETRHRMSEAKKRTIEEKGTDWLKRTYSVESREKMRLAKLKTIAEKGTAWLSRPHTEETKQKMRKPKSVLPPKKKCPYCDKSYRPNWFDRHIKEKHNGR